MLTRLVSGTGKAPASGRSHTVHGFGADSGYSLAAGLDTVNAEYFVPELAARCSPDRCR